MASLFDCLSGELVYMEYLKTIGFYAHLQAVEIMTGETRIEVYVRHRPTKYLVFPRRRVVRVCNPRAWPRLSWIDSTGIL